MDNSNIVFSVDFDTLRPKFTFKWTCLEYREYLNNFKFKTFVTDPVIKGREDDKYINGEYWFAVLL